MINILLVDDNAVNQFIAVKMIQRWGMTVKTASDGMEALKLIGSNSFHLILMDLDMPIMDGYESTRRIREMEGFHFKTLPIIAFTASDIMDARARAIDSGMTDLVAKPLQLEELQNTIDKYVVEMNSTHPASTQFNIDFEQFTDGDEHFKLELVALMLADIKELKRAIGEAMSLNSAGLIHPALHKAKTTVSMVNNDELNQVLEELELYLAPPCPEGVAFLSSKIARFSEITDDLIEVLTNVK